MPKKVYTVDVEVKITTTENIIVNIHAFDEDDMYCSLDTAVEKELKRQHVGQGQDYDYKFTVDHVDEMTLEEYKTDMGE